MMSFEDLTVPELKDLLRERELPVSGKKADLISRLEDFDNNSESNKEEVPEKTSEKIDPEEDQESSDEGEEAQETSDEEMEGDGEFYEDEQFEVWDDFHTARQKPVLDEGTKAALDMRDAQSKKQPAFRRQEWFRYRRLSKTGYRKPKGKDSKMRLNRKYRAPMARIGYGKIASARGLHPSGFEEVLVHTTAEMEGLDPEKQAVRIGSKVGNRSRASIHDKADALGLRILNRRNIDRKGDLR